MGSMGEPLDADREEETMPEMGIVGSGSSVEPGVDPVTGDGLAEPVAVGPGDADGEDGVTDPVASTDVEVTADGPAPGQLAGSDSSLLALVDKLAAVLQRSDLGELEVAAGGTTIVLRAPASIERSVGSLAGVALAEPSPAASDVAGRSGSGSQAARPAEPAARPAVTAPLTGIFYTAPSPGAMPYVAVGDHVSTGQIIGLIEAMKLFNEIKSDLAGRVARVCVDNGALVKAKQALIEVEPV